MRFCPWVPLSEAEAHVPAGPNVLQVRRARGLVAYPKGQSAMVHYQLAGDARAAARQLAARWPGEDLLCRYLIADEEAGEAALPAADRLAAYCDKLLAEFLHRFGALPTSPPSHDSTKKP